MNKRFDHSHPIRKTTSESLRTKVITLTAIAAKVYNVLLLNLFQPEIEKILHRF